MCHSLLRQSPAACARGACTLQIFVPRFFLPFSLESPHPRQCHILSLPQLTFLLCNRNSKPRMATAPDWDGMLTEFLMRDSTTPMQLDALHRLLTMVSEHQTTSHLLPIDEAEEKLRYLGKLQKHWKAHYTKFTGQPKHLHKPLHPLIIATMMMTDLASLREFFGLAGKVRGGFFENWLMELMVVPCFIKTGKSPARQAHEHN